MKFLTDVNASGALAVWLKELGHDIVRVAEQDARMGDDAILAWALREQRIIVTTDEDFEAMIWREAKPHCGVLRLENVPRARRRALLEYVLSHHSLDLATGAIVIAESRKIRIRRTLPRRNGNEDQNE